MRLPIPRTRSPFANVPPFIFQSLLVWSARKGIFLEEANLQGILAARLRPGNVAPTELLTMLSDPRTAICDPSIVSREAETLCQG